MGFWSKLLGVDKIVENQNRSIQLLGEEIDTLRNEFEALLEKERQVGADPEGSPSWLEGPQAVKVLQSRESE